MSTAAGKITIFHSPDIEPLLEHVAAYLATPLGDPFAPEIIVVPHSDMVRYLKRRLSLSLGASHPGRGDGILANVEFVYPRQLANASTTDLLGLSPSPWDAHRLTWSIAHVATSRGVSIPGFERAPLSISRRAADLFDRYASHRPEMLTHWRQPDGVLAGDQLSWLHSDGSQNWQQLLFAAVAEFVDASSQHSSHRASHNIAAFQHAVEAAARDNRLPERITIFGVNALSRSSRHVLEVLSKHVAITIYMVFAPHSSVPQFADTGISVRPENGIGSLTHPLYKRWGVQAIEGAAGIAQLGVLTPIEPQPRDGSLLHRIQLDIISDRDITTSITVPSTTSMGDGSLQIHACYGLTRQAEAVRDSLLHLFNNDSSLRLRDVAILCSDLDAAAPVLHAVLNPPSTKSHHVPPMNIDVLGTTANTADSLSEAFFSLLHLTIARCSPSEIIDVASLPPITRHFGFTDDDIDLLTTWSQQLAVKYGLDGDHRHRVSSMAPTIREGTWQVALQRLFLGIAVPAEIERMGPGNIVPYDGVSGSEIDTAGRVAEFLSRLQSLIALTSNKDGLTVEQWRIVVMSIVDNFLAVAPSDTEKFVRLKATLADIGEDALATGVDAGHIYPVADLMALTAEYFSDSFSVFGSKSEAITVTSMSNLQHLPYRVIVMFGADEAAFAGAHSDGDDVLSNTPCVGEPIYSLTGRQTLLNTLMAARDAFVITCTGADVSNNKAVPLAVPLLELIDIASATAAAHNITGHHRLVTHHPRQNFDARTTTPGVVIADQPFTFDPTAITALEAISHRTSSANTVPHRARAIETPPHQMPDIAQLVRAITNPSEFFVQNVLNVSLPRMPENSQIKETSIVGDAVMNITTDRLQDSTEGRDLLAQVVRHAATDGSYENTIEKWRLLHPATGTLPPGELGSLVVHDIAAEVTSMISCLPPHLQDFPKGRVVDCTVDSLHGQTVLRVPSVLDGSDPYDFTIVRARYKRSSDITQLELWLEVAALTVHYRGAPIQGLLIARKKDSKASLATQLNEIRIEGETNADRLANAQKVIRAAFTIFTAASQSPLPLFENASRPLAQQTLKGTKKLFDTDMQRSSAVRYLYNNHTIKDVLAIPLSDTDRDFLAPFGYPSTKSRAIAYAQLLWLTFDSTRVKPQPKPKAKPKPRAKGSRTKSVGDDAES